MGIENMNPCQPGYQRYKPFHTSLGFSSSTPGTFLGMGVTGEDIGLDTSLLESDTKTPSSAVA